MVGTILIVIAVILLLPTYVYVLSMFAYLGKIAAIRSSMRSRRKNNISEIDKYKGEDDK